VLRDYGYKGEIVIMPNGTDPFTLTDDARREARRRYPMPDGVPALIFTGQQNFKKNPDSVLRACALLKTAGHPMQLLMVGTGPDLHKLKALTETLGLSQEVLFTGFLGERDILMALYERADLMVFPSLYDNAPMVVREAAVMGTPALVIEESCSAEGIVHGQNGYLCKNSPEAIADAILAALPTVQTVGAEAKQTIPIPWDRLILQAEERYKTLIQRKQRGTLHET
jgi:1,2-diacylglycerol 3-alpha-glucosyltransferase